LPNRQKNFILFLQEITVGEHDVMAVYANTLTVLVPRLSTRHLRTALSPGLTVILRGVGRNTDRGR